MLAFKDQDLEIFQKGDFKPIDRTFMTEAFNATRPLMDIQKRYNKLDNDTLFNEIKDGLVGSILGFELVNTHKHGLDAKKENEDVYLEVKQASISASTWAATFNDTNLDKAEAFMDKKLFLALGVWSGLCELQFIVYGQHPDIGNYLRERVINKRPESRSTQTISLKDLVVKYNFEIISNTCTYKELNQLFEMKYGSKRNGAWWKEKLNASS